MIFCRKLLVLFTLLYLTMKMPFASDSTLRHAVTDSLLRRTSSEFKRMGQRIFVFIVGGATRSEVCDLSSY